MPETMPESLEAASKAVSTSNVVAHIVERRIEYLLGTLIAYQLGLLDQLMTYGAGVCA